MRRTIIAASAALTTAGVMLAVPAIADNTSIGAPGAAYVGNFDARHVKGYSLFVQDSDGAAVQTFGRYTKLDKQRAFFTVIYGNRNCDPAQAFPVGPFTSDKHGNASVKAATASNGVNIAGSGSISVRIGDTDKAGNPTDQDGDGKTGAGDVVAVPGKPSIGLVKCDTKIDALP